MLVKRTALAVYPRERVAPLSGEAWAAFIQAHSKVQGGPGLNALVAGPYRRTTDHVAEAITAAREWIVSHRV